VLAVVAASCCCCCWGGRATTVRGVGLGAEAQACKGKNEQGFNHTLTEWAWGLLELSRGRNAVAGTDAFVGCVDNGVVDNQGALAAGKLDDGEIRACGILRV